MFEWSTAVLARTTVCRSRHGACGLEGDREERSNRGLVGHSERNPDELVQRPPPPASEDGRTGCELERERIPAHDDGRHLDPGTAGALTCSGPKRVTRSNPRRPAEGLAPEDGRTEAVAERGVRGFERRSSRGRQRRRSSRARCANVRRLVIGASRDPSSDDLPTRSRRHAVKRGVAGGRIDASRCGAALSPGWRHRGREGGLEAGRWRVSHGARKRASGDGVRGECPRRDVGCRSGFETPWRSHRGKAARPYESESRSDGRRPRARDGAAGSSRSGRARG